MFHFANILFSGPPEHPCNARCPFCIGQQISAPRHQANLDQYPLRGQERFIATVQAEHIRQIVFTGSNTDPLLYRHLECLLGDLRQRLPDAQFSLHTNGRLAFRRVSTLSQFDKICLSLPSFHPATYQRMMGVPHIPDVAAILANVSLPVKLSCVVTNDNAGEIASYLEKCQEMGIRRVVLRKLFGETRPWKELLRFELGKPTRTFCGCCVYDLNGLEVTLWDFAQAQINAINLFSSGEISREYHLPEKPAH
jgi:molybdenum cofactor biosynthesis enzyme MoaA